jgi:hypothetical protein
MTNQGDKNSQDLDGRKRLLRCEKCGASLLTFLHDLLRYTQEGWPKCCDNTMALFVEEPNPATAVQHLNPDSPILPEEARELLDHAQEKAQEVAADIEKSKEILERSAILPSQADGESSAKTKGE